MTLGFKTAMGALSVMIMFTAYGIYIWQTAKKPNVKPHPFSWLLWGSVTGVAFLIQLAEGAGPGSWVMGFTSAICVIIGLYSLSKTRWHFSRFDWLAILTAIVVFAYYLVSKNPTQSAILATTVDVLGYGPTIKKAWERPLDDSIASFSLNSAKFIPSLFAMGAYSIATCLYPATLVMMNCGVAFLLFGRRRKIRSSSQMKAG